MTNRFRFTFLAAAVITSASAAAVAVQMPRQAVIASSRACLAISDNLCFSGSMEWVARAALSPTHQSTTMVAMVAEAN